MVSKTVVNLICESHRVDLVECKPVSPPSPKREAEVSAKSSGIHTRQSATPRSRRSGRRSSFHTPSVLVSDRPTRRCRSKVLDVQSGVWRRTLSSPAGDTGEEGSVVTQDVGSTDSSAYSGDAALGNVGNEGEPSQESGIAVSDPPDQGVREREVSEASGAIEGVRGDSPTDTESEYEIDELPDGRGGDGNDSEGGEGSSSGLSTVGEDRPGRKKWDLKCTALASHLTAGEGWPLAAHPEFGGWISEQRYRRKQGDLLACREAKLTALGIDWHPKAMVWEGRFEEIREYMTTHTEWPLRSDPRFGHWINAQRTHHNAGRMSQVRTDKLNSIGFIWDYNSAVWDGWYRQLVEYRETYPKSDWPKQTHPLGKWLNKQRTRYTKGTLWKDRAEKLDAIGLDWTPKKGVWERKYALLAEHMRTHDEWPIFADPEFGHWIDSQRQAYRLGKLAQYRIDLLNSIGFVWNTNDATFDYRFEALKLYMQTHTRFPSESHPVHGSWMGNLRQFYRKGKVSQERIARLEGIGFKWRATKQ
ncbi:hypothetical protein KIPB_008797 [Kipferlia bialata]|uniref:Helicase-associated domain-containing protein n=1 Tax=Kipferlia bialata TaxID=797122 RepID=A0A9K3D3X7_9EUKA|nr:hypothetical protein KIPB_008797 [Kipferlia bialata]|eukprot:g8797.t1